MAAAGVLAMLLAAGVRADDVRRQSAFTTVPNAASSESSAWPAPELRTSRRPAEEFQPAGFSQPPAETPRPITPAAPRITPPAAENSRPASSTGGLSTTIVALAMIVIAILTAGKLWKKHGPFVAQGLPSEALEFLGKRHLDPRQTIYLMRLGARILVLGSSPAGLNTLAEVTDPIEVDRLAGLCRRREADAASRGTFQAVFQKQTAASDSAPRRRPAPQPEEAHA
jgi:flagellar biogenesis protein FliO